MTTAEILSAAKRASIRMRTAETDVKNRALELMADALEKRKEEILCANKKDVALAKGKINEVMIDRLSLDERRIEGMAQGLKNVALLSDPVGCCYDTIIRPNGLRIEKISVPLGVIGIIYESRPNVTADAAALCIKSGNACVLRCGREAWNSANAIVQILRDCLQCCDLPADGIGLIEDTSRESAREMMEAVGYIDLLIPRGGAGLIRACLENAKVPCIETGTGICHIYVDASADMDMALSILDNAKTSRPSVCNAAEQCLVHKDVASRFLPRMKKRLIDEKLQSGKPAVELRTDERAYACIGGTAAKNIDFTSEFLDYILGVKIVESLDEAIDWIAKHGSGHSECIVTNDKQAAAAFVAGVDCAAVYVNASTRFTDGGEFGLGCEMGISTQKLHARGPMGLRELTTYKYVIHGNGQIRE